MVAPDGNCDTTASTPAPLIHSHESAGGRASGCGSASGSASGSSSVSSSSSAETNSGTLTPDPTSQTSSSGAPHLLPSQHQNDPFGSLAEEKTKLAAQRCCETGRHEIVDPLIGCNCQYEPPRLTFSGYSHLQTTPSAGLYGSPYHQPDQKSYSTSSVDCSPFYSTLVS